MARLKQPEERKRNPHTRADEIVAFHPYRVFQQAQHFREIKGRHDYVLTPNPAYHAPIAYQEGRYFWLDTEDEIPLADVPQYIKDSIARTPIGTPRQLQPVTITAAQLQEHAAAMQEAERAPKPKIDRAKKAREALARKNAQRKAARAAAAAPSIPSVEDVSSEAAS